MPKCWSYSAGERPNTVRVYERTPGGVIYARAWDRTARGGKGNWHVTSLGHRDKQRAKRYAIDQAAKLQNGETQQAKVTLAKVFALYEQHRVPVTKKGRAKAASSQKNERRCIELWTRVLGGACDPHSIRLEQWEALRDGRASGAIDARGNPVDVADRKPVRARPVEYDLKWLLYAFNWAVKWRLPNGQYLMRENPVRGYAIPSEENKLRPVATQDRFEAIRAVSDTHTFRSSWKGKRQVQRSYISELLDIVNGTGRRISAVCALKYDDLRLGRTKGAPHGAIRWPADTDKLGRETTVPIGPEVRSALDRVLRERPGVGSLPLFPSPADKAKPVSQYLADHWLRDVERMAGLEPLRGSLWHAYRRKWATERKHLPDVDVAAAGGWKDTVALKQCYQHSDDVTMLRVVLSAAELREAK